MSWSLVLAALALVACGWLGIARSAELAQTGPRHLILQAVWTVLALASMLLITLPHYRVLARYGYAALCLAICLLLATYALPAVHGTHRWIRFANLSLQPAEFAKLAYVLALARYLMDRDCRPIGALVVPVGLTMVVVLLVLRQPDLGTALVFVPVFFGMLLAANTSLRSLAGLVLCGLALAPILWLGMSREQRSRVTSLFEQTVPGEKPNEEGYQLHQAKRVLTLGGVWGSLLCATPPREPSAYHLPEARTDFIFSVLGERLGWLGTGLVLCLYVFVAWKSLALAEATREPFGRLACVGVTSLLVSQAFINVSMTVGLLPVTGVSLPLVSYGGSGLVAHASALGLVLNVGLRPGHELGGQPFPLVSRRAA